MSREQFTTKIVSPSYWEVTFDNPPINLIGPDTIPQLNNLLARIEADKQLTVVVFKSDDPDFFMAHFDIATDIAAFAALPPGPSGLHPWNDVLVRLSRAPVLTIAALRGRARGAGSEFALACDVRFASREKAVLGQFEVGGGAVPGGGPMARLSRLVGRGRALEILVGADDIPGDVAERYGYVNRAVPDAEFSAFVHGFAKRVAGFEKESIKVTKDFVDQATLPPVSELAANMPAFFASVARPETQARAMALFKAGLQTRAQVELNLGDYVARYAPES
ncbi:MULTISPECIES: enoyl-CoA hydratase/isomerase family protein [unclassified Bradyrhizobium]|uniref:enoyl-CoA hydratase/isomerase family protein n=1 Tax=unclassified Bradyrhizobium TaxID=2631580 RepID=UPI00230658D3|nr:MULTISPECIES: enoyl-CoA hydratase/isomerase family protein [unclassified Bradyrhizobium]MDA9451176.1 enoyl-CoA hydratase [Bradyrhizobium sp. CCBAU 21360]MDA9457555.1 enoyl-CoA hydratase [Bradyrhizobium sp. CCBAU 21359]